MRRDPVSKLMCSPLGWWPVVVHWWSRNANTAAVRVLVLKFCRVMSSDTARCRVEFTYRSRDGSTYHIIRGGTLTSIYPATIIATIGLKPKACFHHCHVKHPRPACSSCLHVATSSAVGWLGGTCVFHLFVPRKSIMQGTHRLFYRVQRQPGTDSASRSGGTVDSRTRHAYILHQETRTEHIFGRLSARLSGLPTTYRGERRYTP